MSEELKRHPLSAIWPDMDEPVFRALVADVKRNGVLHPVVLYEGEVLDGWNRYQAARGALVKCPFTTYEGSYPMEYVIAANAQRRHVSALQRAGCVLATVGMWRGEENSGGYSHKELAGMAGTSASTMFLAKRAAKKGALLDVIAGTMKVVDIASRPKRPPPQIRRELEWQVKFDTLRENASAALELLEDDRDIESAIIVLHGLQEDADL